MQSKELLRIVKADAKKAGITVVIGKGKNVRMQGWATSGYFCDVSMKLAVATGIEESEWFPVLIHEYCHMKQWQEQTPEWLATKVTGDIDVYLNNTSMPDEQADAIINSALVIEVDCERRTVEFIKQHGIDIDTKEYAKKANSYLYFYRMIREAKGFYDSNRKPYRIEAVWSHMPDHFDNDYSTIPPHFAELFRTHCL